MLTVFYLFYLSGNLLLGFYLKNFLPETYILIILGALNVVTLYLLEKKLFLHKEWFWTKKQIVADVFHSLLSNPIPTLIAKIWILPLIHIQLISPELWSSIPLWMAICLGIILGDLPFYLWHRFLHENATLWRWHAVHHSTEHMYFLAGSRTHPIQVLFVVGSQLFFLGILGAPNEVLFAFTVFTSSNGLIQHANLDMKCGWVNYILSSPNMHHIHHHREIKYSDGNYGSNTMIWDLIFKSWIYTDELRLNKDIGLPKTVSWKESYIDHLKMPFDWGKRNKPKSN